MPPASRRRLSARARLAAAAGGVVVAIVLAVAATSLAVERDTISLAPVSAAPGVLDTPSDELTAQLLARTLAMQARAHEIDDLGPESPRRGPTIAIEEPGVLTVLKRALQRSLAYEPRRISVQFSQAGSDIEIALREQPANTRVVSHVRREAANFEAILDAAASDLLLLIAPLDAVSLALEKPGLQQRARDIEKLSVALQRDADAAKDPRALIVAGLREASTGQCRKAIEQFARVMSVQPSSPHAFLHAAECHARLGERDRALSLLTRVEKLPDNPPYVLSLAGQGYQRIGRPQQAFALLAAAQVRDANLLDNATAIGEVLLALHRPEQAIEWLMSHPAPERSRARWLAALGLAQVRTGAGPAAQATAAALRSLDPASIDATRIDAELAAAAKAWPQALGRFGALRLVAPSDGAACAGQGFALLGLRRFDDAADVFAECTEVAPFCADCRRGLAIALREGDRTEAALELLAQAERLDPVDPRIPAETARTLRALLRHNEAAAAGARADAAAERLAKPITLPGP